MFRALKKKIYNNDDMQMLNLEENEKVVKSFNLDSGRETEAEKEWHFPTEMK